MGLKFGADLDVSVMVESLSNLEKKLDEQNKRLREYLTKPHGTIRQLFSVIPTGTTPLVIDLGMPAGGQLWSVQQVCIGEDTPFFAPANPGGGVVTNIAAASNNAAAANNVTLAGVAGATTFITGFEVSGLGATAGSEIAITVTGTSSATTPTYNYAVPAGVTLAAPTLLVEFPTPIPASAVNTNIVVNVPSFGAGNTTASVVAHGFQQTTAVALPAITAGIFVGSIPSTVAANVDFSAISATNLAVPVNYQAGGKSLIARAHQKLYVVISGSGVPASGRSFFATATVLEVPDTTEALLWL